MRSTFESAFLVGRDEERERVLGFVDLSAPAGAIACVIAGEAGIGKTTLWREGVEAAAKTRVSRPREAEASFAFAALADLLDDRPAEVLAELPAPQRRALEIALLLREAGGRTPEPHAVGAATLSALRVLAPLVVAIDDIQWLDRASAEALAFALRRLSPADGVRVLATLRAGGDDPTRAIDDAAVDRIDLAPLSLGAVQRLVAERVAQSLPRRVVRRIYDASRGNPFFAIELARNATPDGELALPRSLTALVGSQLDRVDPEAERAVLAAALVADPRTAIVAAVTGARAVAAAVDAGLLEEEMRTLRLAHPLIGTAARERARPGELRDLHLRLADVVDSREERIRHRALGIAPPDAEVADELELVARDAAARGAGSAAAELSELAWRFTQLEDGGRLGRALAAAEAHRRIGANDRGLAILHDELPRLSPGTDRVRVLFQIATLLVDERPDAFDDALAEATGPLRAEILAEKADRSTTGYAQAIRASRGWAAEAVELARESGDEALLARTLEALAWAEMLLGNDPEPLLRDADAGAGAHALFDHPDRLRGVRAVWRGDAAAAYPILTRLLERATGRDEEFGRVVFLVHLFELELRIGDEHRLARRIAELEEALVPFPEVAPAMIGRTGAALAALEGDVEAALAGLDQATSTVHGSVGWHALEARRSAGVAALVAGNTAEAAGHLLQVWEHLRTAGILEPGAFPVAPDLVEALAAEGRTEEAETVLAELEKAAGAFDHPWARVTSARARAHLLLARDDAEGAEGALQRALVLHEKLDLPRDEARARLALGTLHRRARRRRDARTELEAARDAFERLGASAFAARAADELARVAGRRSAAGLTPTEQRVAALVAESLTNRQIAERLVVSVATIEAHLTRIYAKLGVRGRTELAVKVSGSPD